MSDDYLASINYQIKEEVINNYLRERIIIEEEKKEFSEEVSAYKNMEEAAGQMRDNLACLLITPENMGRFFSLIGIDEFPVSWVRPSDAVNRAPTCPAGLIIQGFTDRGRYLDLVLKTFKRFKQAVEEGREQGERLEALAGEINNDIQKFQRNHDIMSIVGFLNSLDVELLVKKKFMGGNFSPAEIGSIAVTMNIKPVKMDAAPAGSWPELPSLKKVKRLVADFVHEIFRAERDVIRPALH
jgi:hypothetical protein